MGRARLQPCHSGPARMRASAPAMDTGAAASGVRMQPTAQAVGKMGIRRAPTGRKISCHNNTEVPGRGSSERVPPGRHNLAPKRFSADSTSDALKETLKNQTKPQRIILISPPNPAILCDSHGIRFRNPSPPKQLRSLPVTANQPAPKRLRIRSFSVSLLRTAKQTHLRGRVRLIKPRQT